MTTAFHIAAQAAASEDFDVKAGIAGASAGPARTGTHANDDPAAWRRGIAAANDDGVGLAALASGLKATIPVAANDDLADPEPPLPGSYAQVPPAEWTRDHPHVRRLEAELLVVSVDPAIGANDRRVAAALLRALESGGRLPAYGGRVAIQAFRHRYGLSSGSMIAGRSPRGVFERFAPRFLLEEVDSTFGTHSGSVFRASRRNVVSQMRNYVARLVETGDTVPSNGRGGFSVDGVAAALGEETARLRWNVPARRVLREAIADRVVRLGPEHVPVDVLPEADLRARRKAVKAVFAGFDVPGGKVPESPLRRGYIDWEYCASLTGETFPTMSDDPEVRAYGMEIAGRRGVMLPGLTTGVDNLAALRAWGLERVAAEAQGKASAVAIVSNRKSALDRLIEQARLTVDDPASSLFGAETYDAALDRSLAGFGNPRSAANFRRAADAWRELHLARVGAAALPDSLPDALDALLGAHGVTQAAIAEKVGVKPSFVRDLIVGTKSPNPRAMKVVVAIEEEFGLAPGTLTIKADGRRHRPVLADATPEYRALPSRMRPLLPPEATGWSAERLAAAVEQVRPLLSGSTPYGRMLQAGMARGERMPPYAPTSRLEASMVAYRAYKEAPVSHPLERGRGARWKTELSAEMGMKELRLPFRFAVAPVDGGTAAGLAVAPELQTMAWLAHAPFAVALFGQRSVRHADVGDGRGGVRGRVYTVAERHLAAQLLSMTNPRTGWLTQMPELASELVPLDATITADQADLLGMFGLGGDALVLSAEDVALARRDWPAFVARSYAVYKQIVDHLDDVLEVSRNPFDPIRGIVAHAEPQAQLLSCLFEGERCWADARTSPLLHLTDRRNSVMLRLAAITAFRPGNLLGLTYRPDDQGRIRKVDGEWELSVPYREFKNFRNSRLFGTATNPLDYHRRLRDEGGLFDMLDEYFFEVLPQLSTGNEGDAAFVGRFGDPVNAHAWYDIVRNFGRRHVAYNPVLGTGLPGVTSLSPYSFRHIRASDVLRNGTSVDRIEEAAIALQTSPGMVLRHYGFLLPDAAAAGGSDTFGRAVRLAWKKT